MPCQHVLAPVTGTGPSQAAETAATARASPRLGPTWHAPGCRVMGPARTCCHARSSTLGRQSGSFRAYRRFRLRLLILYSLCSSAPIIPFGIGQIAGPGCSSPRREARRPGLDAVVAVGTAAAATRGARKYDSGWCPVGSQAAT
jgi:hypothetical protein